MLALRTYGVKSCVRLPRSITIARNGSQSLLRSSVDRGRPFTSSIIRLKKQDQQDEAQKEKPKPAPRPSAGKTSLRRVSIEAERSRVIVRNRGGRRFVDPDVETKQVAAYCAAEQYNIHQASRLVEADGYELDPYNTGLYPQVIHVQTPILPSRPSTVTLREERDQQDHGDVFIFPSGTVVAWNVPERIALRLVEQILPPAAVNSQSGTVELEKENLEYIEDPTKSHSAIYGDTIVLGTKPEEDEDSEPTEGEASSSEDHQSPEADLVLAKIAFSSGLARSTKLAVLERLTDAYFASTRSIPTIMSRGTPLPFNRPWFLKRLGELLGFDSRLPYSRSFILRKTGELLSIRAQLNLYSELTDSLPDLFWDSKHELGLEGYYDHVGKALDVGVRIQVLNEKMDYAQEIASVLRETLSERHNLRLEWGIILLIAIEVVFELVRGVREYRERHDDDSTEMLLRRWLKKIGAGRETP